MPLIETPTYRPPLLLRQGDLHTIYTALTRRVKEVDFRRERIDTPDGDFMDLDFHAGNTGGRPIALVAHGLEGDAQSSYVRGICKALGEEGFDSVGMNFRSCSGEMNRRLISYHSARTEDMDFIVGLLVERGYDEVVIVGFSLGGNVTLKYAGERENGLRSEVKAVAAVATPCDIPASVAHLQKPRNWIYMQRFMKTLRQKAIEKKQLIPEAPYTIEQARAMRNFMDHDNLVTAPIHGFKDAADYYRIAACKQYLPGLKIPALLINAADAPFLTPSCMPFEEARRNELFFFEMPRYGGHVGFSQSSRMKGRFMHEESIVNWLAKMGLGNKAK